MNNVLKRPAPDEPLNSSRVYKSPRLVAGSATPHSQQHLIAQADLANRWKIAGSSFIDLTTNLATLCKDSIQTVLTGSFAQPQQPVLPFTYNHSNSIYPNSHRTPTTLMASSSTTSSPRLGDASSVATSATPSFSFSSTNRSLNSSIHQPSNDTSTPLTSRAPSTSSQRYTPGISRPYRHREHIFARQHKASIDLLRQQEQQELQSLYQRERKRGYQSDLNTYAGYLQYAFQLEKLEKDRGLRKSPSASDIVKNAETAVVRRRHSMKDDPTQLRRAISSALKSLNGAKRDTIWSPTLSQLELLNRTKDQAIENRLRPKKASLPSSLPPDAERQVDGFLKQKGVVGKCSKEKVQDVDLARLRPGQWLNDEIINFYGAMIHGRSEASNKENTPAKGEKPLNAHYFSSFFWPKLTNDGYEKARLNKWTKRFDIFQKDVVLIPINHGNMHWTSAAINFRRKRIEAYDSMGSAQKHIYRALRQYLDLEHKDKKKKPFDFTGWEDFVHEDMPQQENGFDCGVFTCQVLQALSRGEEIFNFSQQDMPYLRRRMIWEICTGRFWDV